MFPLAASFGLSGSLDISLAAAIGNADQAPDSAGRVPFFNRLTGTTPGACADAGMLTQTF